jgi:hypothetical protein
VSCGLSGVSLARCFAVLAGVAGVSESFFLFCLIGADFLVAAAMSMEESSSDASAAAHAFVAACADLRWRKESEVGVERQIIGGREEERISARLQPTAMKYRINVDCNSQVSSSWELKGCEKGNLKWLWRVITSPQPTI